MCSGRLDRPAAVRQVCDLGSRLLGDGTVRVSWNDLIEHSCRLRVRAREDLRCTLGLRLDVPDARYRRVSKGHTTRMCDFAVLAAAATPAPLLVVELKSGAAYADDHQVVAGRPGLPQV